jgi:hypothetical protein
MGSLPHSAAEALGPPVSFDHDARAARGKEQSVLLAQSAAGAGDHGNLLVESPFVAHQLTGSSFIP